MSDWTWWERIEPFLSGIAVAVGATWLSRLCQTHPDLGAFGIASLVLFMRWYFPKRTLRAVRRALAQPQDRATDRRTG